MGNSSVAANDNTTIINNNLVHISSLEK